MRASHSLVLLVLTFTAVSVAGYLRAPLETSHVRESPSDNKRYISDPLGFESVVYTSSVTIGAKSYRLVVQTASADTFIVSSNCTTTTTNGTVGCSYTSNYYDGTGTLMSYDSNQCTSSIVYNNQANRCADDVSFSSSNSANAVAVTDTLKLGEYSVPTTFAAVYKASSNWLLKGSDGYLGLIRPNPSWKFLQNGPLGALFTAGMPKQFAMCLTTTGGDLHLGGYDITYAKTGAINWIPYVSSSVFYLATVSQVSVNSSALASSSGSATFNSGNTLTYLPAAVYTATVNAIGAYCGGSNGACNMNVFSSPYFTTVDPSVYPNITFAFTDASGSVVNITMTGAQYLWTSASTPGQYTSGFVSSGQNDGAYAIGLSFMRNWYTVFNVEQGTIGITDLAPNKCNATLPPTAPAGSIPPAVVFPPPTVPTSPPTAPSSTPQAPSSTPQAPSSTPSTTPQAPSSTPQAPSSTPQAPSSTPQAPSSTPQAPSSTPQAPSSVVPNTPVFQPAPSSAPSSPAPSSSPSVITPSPAATPSAPASGPQAPSTVAPGTPPVTAAPGVAPSPGTQPSVPTPSGGSHMVISGSLVVIAAMIALLA